MTGSGVIRCVPLWQPWGTLVMVSEKRIETRPAMPPRTVLGRRVAVHACATRRSMWLAERPPFLGVLVHHGYAGEAQLPLGALLGTVVVAGARPITRELAADLQRDEPLEHAFGDYSVGRWAWDLRDPDPLPEPIPWKGKQGIMKVPAHLLGLQGDPDPVQETLAL